MTHSAPARPARLRGVALALALAAAVSGCASAPANPRDPFEKFNRAMFSFNDTVDQVALKPAATAYKRVLPSFVQTGIGNFFGNLADIWSAANNLMQGKGAEGMSDVARFAMNTTFGLGGVLDIASEAGLHKHNEDFGQTLGSWGVGPGPYLMLPLLGPSTVRDTLALPLDIKADPWAYKEPIRWRNVGIATRAVDQRAAVLDASNLMEEAALDRYEFVRDSFLQRRESRINDGDDSGKKNKKGAKGGKLSSAYDDEDAPVKTPAVSSEVATKELSKEAAPETVKVVTKETVNDVAKEAAKETVNDMPKDPGKDAGSGSQPNN